MFDASYMSTSFLSMVKYHFNRNFTVSILYLFTFSQQLDTNICTIHSAMNLLLVNSLLLFQLPKNLVESRPTPCTNEFMDRAQYYEGKCQDESQSYDYKISIRNAPECARKCDRDARCAYFSYYNGDADNPHNLHCYFFTSCDLDNLQDKDSTWLSGPSAHGTCLPHHPGPFILPLPRLS